MKKAMKTGASHERKITPIRVNHAKKPGRISKTRKINFSFPFNSVALPIFKYALSKIFNFSNFQQC